jgi:hypothetical protein
MVKVIAVVPVTVPVHSAAGCGSLPRTLGSSHASSLVSSCAAPAGTLACYRPPDEFLPARSGRTTGDRSSMVFSETRASCIIITTPCLKCFTCLPSSHAPQGILRDMGGPAAGVLLHRVPEDYEILELQTWLATTAEFYDGSGDADLREGWEFFLNWPPTLGNEPPEGPCLGGVQMSIIDPEAEFSGSSHLSQADWARYRQALGWMPTCELAAWINCRRPRDHMLLGWFCAELATRFDGMIDLGGTLSLPNRDEWSRVGLAGRLVKATYSIDADRVAQVHLVDPDFLRAWMLQPRFHMIK